MSRKSNAKAPVNPLSQDILDELFPGEYDGSLIALSHALCVAIGRVIIAVTALGGMVTVYRGSVNHSLVLSFRVGERKRSVELDGDDGSVVTLDQLANGIEQAYAKHVARQRDP